VSLKPSCVSSWLAPPVAVCHRRRPRQHPVHFGALQLPRCAIDTHQSARLLQPLSQGRFSSQLHAPMSNRACSLRLAPTGSRRMDAILQPSE